MTAPEKILKTRQPYCQYWRHCLCGDGCYRALTLGIESEHNRTKRPLLTAPDVPACFVAVRGDEVSAEWAAHLARVEQGRGFCADTKRRMI